MPSPVTRPVILALLAALGACRPSARGPALPPIADRVWSLQTLEGAPLDSAVRKHPPTLLLTAAGTRVSGYSGCNRFAGSVTLGPGIIEFGPLALTRMACRSMELETRYTRTLAAVRQFRLDRDALVLAAGDSELARFTLTAGRSR